jgi:predicted metal-dependent hydrolase
MVDAVFVLFPEGERAFIETVRPHREKIRGNSELQRDAAEFVAQDGLDTRERLCYNAQLNGAKHAGSCAGRTCRRAAGARSPLSASRCGLTTAAFSGISRLCSPMNSCQSPCTRRFLRRNGRPLAMTRIEEIEQKATTFDVFMEVVHSVVT